MEIMLTKAQIEMLKEIDNQVDRLSFWNFEDEYNLEHHWENFLLGVLTKERS